MKKGNTWNRAIRVISVAFFVMSAPNWVWADAQTARVVYDKGVQLETAQEYVGAITQFQASLKADPTFSMAWKEMGNCYYNLSSMTYALQCYDRYLALNPNDKQVRALADMLRQPIAAPGDMQQNAVLPGGPNQLPVLAGATQQQTASVNQMSATKPGARKKTSVFFKFGGVVPASPDNFETYWKMGSDFGLGVGTQLTRITTAQFDISYSSFGLNEKEMQDQLYSVTFDNDSYDVRFDGGAVHILSFLANAKLHFTGSDAKVKPYFIGGLGMSMMSVDEITVSYQGDSETITSSSDSNFELRLALGLDFKIGNSTFLFIEDNGYSMMTEGDSTSWGSLDLGMGIKF